MANERVLVVDDEKNIRLTLRQVLEDEGFHVETASDGDEALERVRAQDDYLFVLLDLKMPGTGGMEVLRHVRELRPALPVVVFTAHGSAENATEAMKLGATDFAEKPFSPTQIRALVKSVRGTDARPSTDAENDTSDDAGNDADAARHPYRTLVLLSDADSVEPLLRLAAASAHSHEHGEVVAVGLAPPTGDGADTDDAWPESLTAATGHAEDLGVAVRTRTIEAATPHAALADVAAEETPDHALLEWSGPPGEARALGTLAQQVAEEAGCEVTLVRPGARAMTQRIAAVVSEEPHALVAVRRALEFAKSAGVATLTLLNVQPPPPENEDGSPVEDGLALIHRVARQVGLPKDKYYTQVAVAQDVAGALPRVAEDFDTFCISATHAETLASALFGDDENDGRIAGTVALTRGAEQDPPPIMASLIERLTSN